MGAEQVFDPRKRDVPAWSLEEFRANIGERIGTSDWITMTQEMVDKHADASHDWNFIHVDPKMTEAETGMPGTIAHGFLTLSLLSQFSYQVSPTVKGAVLGLNYGLDKARMISQVPVGARVRGHITLGSVEERPNGVVIGYDVTVEIENHDKPAVAARWLTYAQTGAA